MVVSALHTKLEYKVEHLKYKKLEIIRTAEDQKQIQTSSKWVISIMDQSKWSLQSWLIYTVSFLLAKNDKFEWMGSLK